MFIRRFFPETHAVACVLLALAATAAADIVIEQKMEGTVQNGTMTLSIKGEKMRTDLGKDTTSIMDLGSRKMITLMHEQKMVMEMKLPDTAELKAPDGTPLPEPKITHTGKKEKVNGHDCEIVTMELAGGKTTMRMWVDKDYPNYDKLKKELEVLNKAALYGGSSMDVGGMVIKTEVDMEGVKITTTLVSAKETTLKDEIFKAPAGYTALPVPGQ